MTALPAKTSISDTYPNPSNATARAGFAQLWNAINEAVEKPELGLASGTTCDIGGQLSTKLYITGTTTITSFGTNYRGPILLRFAGAVLITHNSTTLVCPGGVSITTKAEDAFIAWPKASIGIADGWLIVKASFAPATTSTQGVVELATDAEAQTGTDATRCVTPDNLGAVVLGLGQTWQNMTASRAANTAYTNSTGRSIVVSVGMSSSSANAAATIIINGVTTIYGSSGSSNPGEFLYVSAVVPAGATYKATTTLGTPSIVTNGWTELR